MRDRNLPYRFLRGQPLNNLSQLRRLLEGGGYSSKYDMRQLTGCGFRSLESYTGYSPFHIDHDALRF